VSWVVPSLATAIAGGGVAVAVSKIDKCVRVKTIARLASAGLRVVSESEPSRLAALSELSIKRRHRWSPLHRSGEPDGRFLNR
jgi:hypothetical protein